MLRIAPQDILARTELEPPIAFQKRAARVLDELTRETPGCAVEFSDFEQHPLLLFRSELMRRAGAAMSALTLVERAIELPGAHDGVVLTPTMPSLSLYRAARAYSSTTGRTVQVEPARSHQREELRIAAFHHLERLGWLWRPDTVTRGGQTGPFPVLFAAQQPGHIQDIAPVVSRLRDDDVPIRVLASDLRVVRAADKAGIAVELLPITPGQRLRALHMAHRARRVIRQALRSASLPSLRPSGPTTTALFGQLVDQLLHNQLHRIWGAAQPAAAEVAHAGTVVLPNPYTEFGRLVGGLARHRGVRVVALQHGSILSDDPRWSDITADVVCAWGVPASQALESCGVEPDTIRITGSPKSDSFLIDPPQRRPGHDASVLVATSGPGDRVSPEQHELFVAELVHAVEKSPEIEWTVKLHPKDQARYYRALPDRVRVILPDHSRLSIYDYLAESTAMVTIASTAVVDAVIAGVPAVLFEVRGSDDAVTAPLLREASKVVVSTGEELARALRDVLADPVPTAEPDYLARHFANAGHAVDAITDLVVRNRRER